MGIITERSRRPAARTSAPILFIFIPTDMHKKDLLYVKRIHSISKIVKGLKLIKIASVIIKKRMNVDIN